MLVSIICLVLTTAICSSLVSHALAARARAERMGWQLQAQWLAESTMAYLAVQESENRSEGVHEWSVENIGKEGQSGVISAVIETSEDRDGHRAIRVTADFPDHPTERVRVVLSRTLPASGDVTPSETDLP